ncbi:hypothetical protein [Halomicrobium urmianum]|uniref:hypothetical protein n=1 Tax=Halomicrobium urmianum TaxID=1586233 RepID=UPI001CD9E323|nr:hypothetical protein [Halomicrobium urmianum]
MTNSQTKSGSSSQRVPRAIIHKNILDEAEKQPDASVEEIADNVSGASVKLAKKVLEEYGDPASDGGAVHSTPDPKRDDADASVDGATDPDHDGGSLDSIDYLHLSENQKQLLQTVYEYPDATKAQLADRLGCSVDEVLRTVDSISNFEWERRRETVQRLFDDRRNRDDEREAGGDSMGEVAAKVDELESQVSDLERTIEGKSPGLEESLSDPDLLHRVIQACMASDHISEEEELDIIKQLVE